MSGKRPLSWGRGATTGAVAGTGTAAGRSAASAPGQQPSTARATKPKRRTETSPSPTLACSPGEEARPPGRFGQLAPRRAGRPQARRGNSPARQERPSRNDAPKHPPPRPSPALLGKRRDRRAVSGNWHRGGQVGRKRAGATAQHGKSDQAETTHRNIPLPDPRLRRNPGRPLPSGGGNVLRERIWSQANAPRQGTAACG